MATQQTTIDFIVEQLGGAACHTGYRSCFYRKVADGELVIHESDRVFDPAAVYGSKEPLPQSAEQPRRTT